MAKLALKGGKPVRRKPFPTWPICDEREVEAVKGILLSGNWWYGEKVREFEGKFARFQDAQFGVTAANGTLALEIALICSGIGPGDEVIIPSYTFVATASAVLRANAIPVFADVEVDTFNINPDSIEEVVNEKTRAIIPVHFAGLPCDMDRILSLGEKHNLKVIEDACHSWGSKWKGKGTGAIGEAGVFSFQATKNITSGEGGIILTDDEELAELCRSYSNCGRKKDKPWYEHYILGGNYRLTEFQAAILLVQMERLPHHTEIRQRNARYLNRELSKIEGIKALKEDQRANPRAYHLYCFRYIRSEFDGLPREQFLQALQEEGIPARSGYPHPLYKNPLFHRKGEGPKFCPLSCPYYGVERDYTKLYLPGAEQVCQEAVWIPHPVLLGEEEDMADIVQAIKKVRENTRELR